MAEAGSRTAGSRRQTRKARTACLPDRTGRRPPPGQPPGHVRLSDHPCRRLPPCRTPRRRLREQSQPGWRPLRLRRRHPDRNRACTDGARPRRRTPRQANQKRRLSGLCALSWAIRRRTAGPPAQRHLEPYPAPRKQGAALGADARRSPNRSLPDGRRLRPSAGHRHPAPVVRTRTGGCRPSTMNFIFFATGDSMQANLIELSMYQISQLFLMPTLVLIAALFLYAFWVLGEFALLAWYRRQGKGRPLVSIFRQILGESGAKDIGKTLAQKIAKAAIGIPKTALGEGSENVVQ